MQKRKHSGRSRGLGSDSFPGDDMLTVVLSSLKKNFCSHLTLRRVIFNSTDESMSTAKLHSLCPSHHTCDYRCRPEHGKQIGWRQESQRE